MKIEHYKQITIKSTVSDTTQSTSTRYVDAKT